MTPPILPPDEHDRLRLLLALKRHEVPPPGYFQFFPARVIARIQAAEMAPVQPWWERWLETWMARPAAATLGGLLLGAFMVSLAGPGGTSAEADLMADSRLEPRVMVAPPALGVVRLEHLARVPQIVDAHSAPSVSPLVERSSPFGRSFLSMGDVQPASYTPLR